MFELLHFRCPFKLLRVMKIRVEELNIEATTIDRAQVVISLAYQSNDQI